MTFRRGLLVGIFLGRCQLSTYNSDFAGCFDSDSDSAALNFQDRNGDVIANANRLLGFACENEHRALLCEEKNMT